jgi:cbb3-type cytochrome oxidase subunit 3
LGELYGFLRQLWVVWLLLIFAAIVAWAFWPSTRRKREMEDHARIPLRDEEADQPPGAGDDNDRRGS